MKNYVVKVEVKASVAGYDLAGEEAIVSLGVNAIPSVELHCAPKTAPGIAPMNACVLKPTISDYSDMYRNLAEKAEGLSETGNVSIRLTGDVTDSISLKGWVLAGAGLYGIGSTAAPHLTVIFQHPICRLTKVGSIYETAIRDFDLGLDNVTGAKGNFIEILGAAYDFVRKAGDDLFLPCPKGYNQPKMFRQKLGTGEFDPRRYLKWSGGNGVFLAGSDDGAKVRIAQAIGRMVYPDSGGSSTWDTIMSACGALLLNVTQDSGSNFETDQLVLEPAQPWKKPSITLDEKMCTSTEIPGSDPFRLIGVMATKFGGCSGPISQGLYKNGNPSEKDPVKEVLYVPVKDATDANGRIMKTAAPKILDGAYRRDAESGETISQGCAAMQELAKDGFNGAIGKYCQAVYETSAASLVQASATMIPMFKDSSGNKILPGNTCRFKAEGKDIYFGYIRKVVHNLSTEGGNCTVVSMSHVRPKEDFYIGKSVAIRSGSPNAAYK